MSQFFLLLLLCFLCGCTSTRPPERKSEIPADIQIGNQVLRSIQNGSFKMLSNALSGRTTLTISKKEFDDSVKNLNARMGRITAFRYLVPLETPLVRNYVWIVSFEKKTPGGTVLRDVLFRLICVSVDGSARVSALGFF